MSNPACVGKTYEVFTLANYPYPTDLSKQFQRLLPDIAVEKLSEEALFNQCYTQYALLQQLVSNSFIHSLTNSLTYLLTHLLV